MVDQCKTINEEFRGKEEAIKHQKWKAKAVSDQCSNNAKVTKPGLTKQFISVYLQEQKKKSKNTTVAKVKECITINTKQITNSESK